VAFGVFASFLEGKCLFSYIYEVLLWSQYSLTSLRFTVQAEITSGQINTLLEATGNTEVEAFYPIIYANFLSNPAKVAELITTPGGSGGAGGAAGAGAAAEEEVVEEEVVEEEEADIGGGIDMFGGDAAGGDY